MFTLFTCPKPFVEPFDTIQRNAIRSWLLLTPSCEVILFGDDRGVAEASREFGIRHVPDVARNSRGRPLLSDYFRQAEAVARNELLCYMNADVVLLNDVMMATANVARHFRRFLMVARRRNLDVRDAMQFDDGWEQEIRREAHKRGELAGPGSIELFVYRKATLGPIPPFAVGRPVYDNWFLFHARSLGLAVVDATDVVTCVHQSHRSHAAPSARNRSPEDDDFWFGEEAARNRELAGGWDNVWSATDVEWRLTHTGLRRNWCGDDAVRCAEIDRALAPRARLLATVPGCGMLIAWYELRIRLSKAGRGELLPLLKYPGWLACFVIGSGSGGERPVPGKGDCPGSKAREV